MSNKIANWWRSQRFKLALTRGDTRSAVQLLQEIQKSGVRLSWLEKLFKDKLQFERYSQQYKSETENLSIKLNEALQQLENLKFQLAFDQEDSKLAPNIELIAYINKTFDFILHDEKMNLVGIAQP